jgi:hypothetical protein
LGLTRSGRVIESLNQDEKAPLEIVSQWCFFFLNRIAILYMVICSEYVPESGNSYQGNPRAGTVENLWQKGMDPDKLSTCTIF